MALNASHCILPAPSLTATLRAKPLRLSRGLASKHTNQQERQCSLTAPLRLKRQPDRSYSAGSRRSTTCTAALPKWTDIDEAFSHLTQEGVPQRVWDPAISGTSGPHPPTQDGVTVLYRDRNGWCPYSERVWLGLVFKGVEFEEVLIDNQGSKPSFWYQLGGGTTPAVRWPDGTVQGESLDILYEMDARFPDTPSLLPPGGETARVAGMMRELLPRACRPSSRAAFLYRGSGPVPRRDFEQSLAAVDALLEERGGPFFMGPEFSAADCAWVPFLERYAVQLPLLHEGLHPRDPERWPHLSRWYRTMEQDVPGYAARVQGDPLSWAAVLAEAGYGNAGAAEGYKAPQEGPGEGGLRAPGAAQQAWALHAHRWEGQVGRTPAEEAAYRLFVNRTAVVADIVKRHRGLKKKDAGAVDGALVVCVRTMLSESGTDCDDMLSKMTEEDKLTVREVAAYLDTRICVPRDMGRLPADSYHRTLGRLCDIVDD